MSLLIETIKIHDRKIFNIDYHNKRFNQSRRLLLNKDENIDLSEKIIFPKNLNDDLYKCRIVYSEQIDEITFEKYRCRKINSLKIIHDDEIDYSYKFLNRDGLNILFNKRSNCDDILIVKNGLLTDTSFSNIVLQKGSSFITPTQPLLKGTKREYLLSKDLITEQDIKVEDLKKFEKLIIINSMIDMKDDLSVAIDNIY